MFQEMITTYRKKNKPGEDTVRNNEKVDSGPVQNGGAILED